MSLEATAIAREILTAPPPAPTPPAAEVAPPVAAAETTIAEPPVSEPPAVDPAVAEPEAAAPPLIDDGPPETLGPLPFDQAFEGVELTAEEKARIDAAMALDPSDPKRNEAIIGAYQAAGRGSKLYGNFKALRDWTENFGKIPTAAEIKSFRDLQLSHQLMEHQFDNGTPEQQQAWFQHWFVNHENGKLREGAAKLLERQPDIVWQAAPEAYEVAERAWVSRFADYAKQMALNTGDAAWKAVAENVQYAYLTPGKFTPVGQATEPAQNGHSNGQANGQPVPPEIQQRLRQLEERDQAYQRQHQQQQMGAYAQQITDAQKSVIDEKVFSVWNVSPSERTAHTLALTQGIQRALAADQNFKVEYGMARENALRTGDPQAWATAVGLYRQYAERALGAVVWPEYKKGLQRPNADLRKTSEERHQVQAAAQALTQAGAGGTPVPAAAARTIERPRGMNDRDFARTLARQALSSTG